MIPLCSICGTSLVDDAIDGLDRMYYYVFFLFRVLVPEMLTLKLLLLHTVPHVPIRGCLASTCLGFLSQIFGYIQVGFNEVLHAVCIGVVVSLSLSANTTSWQKPSMWLPSTPA